MKKYDKVLVASNLGENTGMLLMKAKSMAEESSHITLLHVVPPVDVNLYGAMPYLPIFPIVDKDALEKQIYHRKNEMFAAIANAFGLSKEQCIIELGNPKKRIIEFASINEYDLIIAASHEQKPLGPYLGSTSRSILQHANCDVLIVHH